MSTNAFLFFILVETREFRLKKGSPYVIYAFGAADPAPGADISYHQSNRGSQVLNLISAPKLTTVNVPNLEVIPYTLSNVKELLVLSFLYLTR